MWINFNIIYALKNDCMKYSDTVQLGTNATHDYENDEEHSPNESPCFETDTNDNINVEVEAEDRNGMQDNIIYFIVFFFTLHLWIPDDESKN